MSRRIYTKKNSRTSKWWVQAEYNIHMYDNRWQTKLNNNTHTTHRFTKIEDVYTDTKQSKKFLQRIKNIAMKYWYTPISKLYWKEQNIEHYSWKYNQTLPDSRITSSFNNMACNLWKEFPQSMIVSKIKTKMHNFGIHYWRWWHPSFWTAFLCWYYTEWPFDTIYWLENIRSFMVNVEKQPEDIVKLFNRWYTLIQQRIAKVDFNEDDKRKVNEIIKRDKSFRQANYEKLIKTFGQYDTTHFTVIYYNKEKKVIEEIGNWGSTSITENLEYDLKTRIEFIKKWYISPNLFFIGQAVED